MYMDILVASKTGIVALYIRWTFCEMGPEVCMTKIPYEVDLDLYDKVDVNVPFLFVLISFYWTSFVLIRQFAGEQG
jgi:hypothetical protein